MLDRGSIAAIALAAALTLPAGAQAHDETKYPDWSGQWIRTYTGNPRYDASKPLRKQEAPLKPQYQAIFEKSIHDQDLGGHGNDLAYTCLPQGMPRQMSGVSKFEFLISPKVTHMLFERTEMPPRRIYTDGRDWPQTEETWFVGYSIGKWLDTDNDGRYDTLEVETRHLKGPRTFDSTGIPMHNDNKTVVKERIFWDKANPHTLRNDITTIDNALTHPWTITKIYRRAANKGPIWWRESICAENNSLVRIGKEVYYTSADGLLMPAKKDQPPPDLRYFNQAGR